MTHNSAYIEELASKIEDGTITITEQQQFLDWYNNHDDTKAGIHIQEDESEQQVKARMLTALLSRISKGNKNVSKGSKFRRYYSPWVAAAILLIALTTTWYIIQHRGQKTDIQHTAETILPGGNKATLTLASGQKIVLSDSQEGIVIGSEITYIDGTEVSNSVSEHNEAITSLALQTPRGGTYKVTLSDGTKVWLNAESRLEYPSRFADDQREVRLDGEAYFEVSTSKHKNGTNIPFFVKSAQQDIEVIGTAFNISCYPEQAFAKTTLIEGKIALRDNKRTYILSPGQQASTSPTKTQIQVVNVNTFSAWREGKFSFEGKKFDEVMAEIGRWYNLTILYENDIPTEELVGDAFRNQNLRLVLRLLDVAEINYKLDVSKRQLTIKEKIKPIKH